VAKKPISASEKAAYDQRSIEIRRALRRFPKYAEHHEDWAVSAQAKCANEPAVAPGVHARHVALDWIAKEKRRGIALAGAMSSGHESPWAASDNSEELRRYSKGEEQALRGEVRELCETAYKESWGKDWAPAKAWKRTWAAAGKRTLLEMFQAIDAEGPDDPTEEADARKKLAEVRARGPLGDRPPERGGAAVETLWQVQKLVEAYDKRISSFGEWGHLDRSPLRRFVARARLDAAIQIALGCTRRPAKEAPDSKPNPRWVTRPNVDELTVICLLAGFWPEIREWPPKGISAPELIREKARKTIKAAVDAVGSYPYETEK